VGKILSAVLQEGNHDCHQITLATCLSNYSIREAALIQLQSLIYLTLVAGQLSDMMGTDLTKASNFVRQFCRPYLLIFC